jgi:hypothetical protein
MEFCEPAVSLAVVKLDHAEAAVALLLVRGGLGKCVHRGELETQYYVVCPAVRVNAGA